MKEFLVGSAAIVLAGAAFAQAPVAAPVPPAAHVAPMHDRVQTRAEVVAKVGEHFAQLDANKDGSLTKAEAEAGRAAFKQRLGQKLGERRDPAQAFDRLDSNKDGSISRDEFNTGHEMRIERRMAMKDGAPGQPGGMGHKGMRMHRFGMMGGRMFDMADANKDGRVTLQEATNAAVQHFDMADTNRDGQVTPDERRQMHRQMMEKHRAAKTG